MVLAVTAAIGSALAGGGPAAAETPVVGVSASSAEPGQTVIVTSRGWAPGTIVNLELCGASGLESSASCVVSSSVAATANETGEVLETLEVEIPPVPCPCVVRASAAGTSVTAPLAVAGAPVVRAVDPDAPAPGSVDVTDVYLRGSGPWTSWFGAAPVRQLVVKLHNPGEEVAEGVELAVTVGRGETPSRIVPVPDVDPIEPGQTVTYRIPVSFGGLAFGRYHVRIDVDGIDHPVTRTEGTSVYPWGLALVVLVLAQLVLLGVRNRLRRRVLRDERGETSADGVVIDLAEPAWGAARETAPVRDAVAALETRTGRLLDELARQIDELRSELAGACSDLRAETTALRTRQDEAAAAARAGLAAVAEAFERLGGGDADVIDLRQPSPRAVHGSP